MAFFAVFIPQSKAGFEGNLAQCAGSIAAENIQISPEYADNGTDDETTAYDDPEYPPDSPLWLIFKEKSKALDVLRHYKEARLREFPNREQAESYVQYGFESIQSLKRYGKAKPVSKPIPLPTTLNYKPNAESADSPYSSSPTAIVSSMSKLNLSTLNGTNNNNNSNNVNTSNVLNGERPPFRAPTKQELVEFRKQIEAGNYERVKRIVWDNPRYLISSGDTPTSLKEGYRYNAMHICAQVNQARIAELILKTVSDREFTQLYAGKKSSGEMCAALNVNLLDYYLNMPDKGRGETPLHFAVKNGHVPMVEVLISYPQCKSLKNTEGNHPKDIICQRVSNPSPEVIAKLDMLLSEPHYVPVLRAVGNELPPQIGQPFTPSVPPNLQYKNEESDRLNVDLKISALAGPMSREQAFNFHRRWKTPPRVGSNTISPLASSPYISPMKSPSSSFSNHSPGSTSRGRRKLFSGTQTTTPSKALNEANGNHKLAQLETHTSSPIVEPIEHNNNCTYNSSCVAKRMLGMPSTPMMRMNRDLFFEYRDNFSPPPADTSLDAWETSLNMSVSTLNDSFRERHIKNSDIEKGLEVVGRHLARQELLGWREYWDFLDTFVDMASIEGLRCLENYLAAKHEQTQASTLAEKFDQALNLSQMNQYIDLVADRDRDKASSSSVAAAGAITTQVMTPYTCVEKSLQVFAKRITKTLINNIGNMVSINDTLLSELKRLKSLIVSFKDDARFVTVDFGKVHSRIAHLVASYIAHSQEVSSEQRDQLMQMLDKMLQLNADRREHLHCVCDSMLQMLEKAPAVKLPDALKTEELCTAAWELEQGCNCLWDANLSRKTSRRKRTESMRAQAQDIANAVTTLTSAAAALRNSASSNVAIVSPVSNAWRSTDNQSDDDDDDDSDDDSLFFDCCNESEVSDDEEDAYGTPPESPTPGLSSDLDPPYELYIFGKEPTKRDLDVLNAIFHADIDKETLPFVHAWKSAMDSFSLSEMDLFPSPKNVQKLHKSSYLIGSPAFTSAAVGNAISTIVTEGVTLLHAKKILATPKLNLNPGRSRQPASTPTTPPKPQPWQFNTSSPMQTFATLSMANVQQKLTVAAVSQSFQTPLNKMRGLFSKIREPSKEESPMATPPDYATHKLGARTLSLDDSD